MPSSNPSSPPDRPTTGTGATPIGEQPRRKRPWWLLILIAAVIVVALILLLSRCAGGDDNDAARPATSAADSTTTSSDTGSSADNAGVSTPAATSPAADSPTANTPAASTPAATAPTAGPGTLTANGTSLLPIATAAGSGGDLSRYVGQAAARGVLVLSAPADNGFWVGTSTIDQVYVHLLQPGLVSPHPVRAGDHISFTGNVVANSATLAADDGVDAAEGAAQLTAQKAHIEIAKSSVVFTS